MSEPDFLTVAQQLAATPQPVRFRAFDLSAGFFLEMFAGQWLVRRFDRGYRSIKQRIFCAPTQDFNEMLTCIREHFPPQLSEPVFDPNRPSRYAGDNAYNHWLRSATPADVRSEDFDRFLTCCQMLMSNYQIRWHIEQRMGGGALFFARLAFLLAIGLLTSGVVLAGLRHQYPTLIFTLLGFAVAKLLSAVACTHNNPARSRPTN